MSIRILGWLIFVLMVSACTSQQLDTPIPTQTLIPPTITPTVTPMLPTITPQNLPAPQDLILTPSPTALLPLIATTFDFDPAVVELTQIDLANNIGVSSERLQLVKVRPRLFAVVSCPTSRFPVPPPLSTGLEITWSVDNQTHTYLTWHDDKFVWCTIDRLRGEYLNAIDPIAAELSALAIRRVSQQTDVSSANLELVDVIPVEWHDTSLGCPQAGQVYSDVLINGFRIVVSDGGTNYLFHTDSVQLVPCDFNRESN